MAMAAQNLTKAHCLVTRLVVLQFMPENNISLAYQLKYKFNFNLRPAKLQHSTYSFYFACLENLLTGLDPQM
jgi:hypothetical protein